jgi:hypothetical protein
MLPGCGWLAKNEHPAVNYKKSIQIISNTSRGRCGTATTGSFVIIALCIDVHGILTDIERPQYDTSLRRAGQYVRLILCLT